MVMGETCLKLHWEKITKQLIISSHFREFFINRRYGILKREIQKKKKRLAHKVNKALQPISKETPSKIEISWASKKII